MTTHYRRQSDPKPDPSRVGRIRIVIIDDHPIIRAGLTEVLNKEPDLSVIGDANTVATGLARTQELRPDLAIVDLSIGPDSGLGLVREIDATLPDVRVLVFSMHDETLYAERALSAGARGYVMKEAATGNLVAAVRIVAGGGIYVSARVAERVMGRMTGKVRPTAHAAAFERLTDREREVLGLIGRGITTQKIAKQMALSVKTIETYQARIKEKLGLANANELIRAAVTWAQL